MGMSTSRRAWSAVIAALLLSTAACGGGVAPEPPPTAESVREAQRVQEGDAPPPAAVEGRSEPPRQGDQPDDGLGAGSPGRDDRCEGACGKAFPR
jgi:hypothetical protein